MAARITPRSSLPTGPSATRLAWKERARTLAALLIIVAVAGCRNEESPSANDRQAGGKPASGRERDGQRGGEATSQGEDGMLPKNAAAAPGDNEVVTSPSAPQTVDRASSAEIKPAPTDAYNLLLITLDTTRADHLGCYGYPRATSPVLDAFAKESLVFDHCIAPMAQTLPSHTSLMTGLYPLEHGVMANAKRNDEQFMQSEDLRSAADIIRRHGWHTAAFVSAPPVAEGSGIETGFESWWQPRLRCPAMETVGAALEWLGHRDGRPFFMWVHLFDPHRPYEPLAPYDAMFKVDEALKDWMAAGKIPATREIRRRVKGGEEKSESLDWREFINAYDAEIRQMDDQVGKLLQRVKADGVWNRTIIVVTADHGESLAQHDCEQHSHIWGEQLHVPLMICAPGAAPRRVATTLSTIDILPTALALGGAGRFPAAEFMHQATGKNVLAEDFVARPVFSQMPFYTPVGERTRHGAGYTVTTAEWKLVVDLDGGDHLYNTKADPLELTNVIDQHAAVASRLRAELDRVLSEQKSKVRSRGSVPKVIKMSPERKRGLQELGYIEDDDADEVEGEHAGQVDDRPDEKR